MDYEVIGEVRCKLGEGATLASRRAVSVLGGHRRRETLSLRSRRRPLRVGPAGRPIGGLTFQADGSLLLLRDRGRVETWRTGRREKVVIDEIPAEAGTRFNDCIADPQGRVYCGTMAPDGQGRLYRIDTDGSYRVLLNDVACANGLGFTPDLSATLLHGIPGQHDLGVRLRGGRRGLERPAGVRPSDAAARCPTD